MKSLKTLWMIIFDTIAVLGIIAAANTYLLLYTGLFGGKSTIFDGWLIFVVMLISPARLYPPVFSSRIKTLRNGLNLLVLFCISCFMLILLNIFMWTGQTPLPSLPAQPVFWLVNTLITVAVMTVLFFAGMIRVYITSEQLAVRWRVLGLACGFIPVLNLILLAKIISVVSAEVDFENARQIVDALRKEQEVCRTKYPILLVHGVFFRDFKYLNYWGRIPKALEANGATLYYGEHQSAASVAECGQELADRIEKLVKETGCEKINVIAHSKGGLDMRYAISKCGADKYVASLTTVNTPHRGCEFADYLLNKIPEKEQQMIAAKYNSAFKNLGDEHPDFLKAVGDLTHSACEKFNEEVKDVGTIIYRSVGSKLNRGGGGRFPLNMSYLLVKYFDGENDGLVGRKSFEWGRDYKYLTVRGDRGISHGDMIDLNRENIPEFDVREFYIRLVNELKNMDL